MSNFEGSQPIYMGGERFRTTMQMYFQTVRFILCVLLILLPLVFWGSYKIVVSQDEHNVLIAIVKAQLFSSINRNKQINVSLDGIVYSGTPEQVLKDPAVLDIKEKVINKIKLIGILTALVMIFIGFIIARYLIKKAGDFKKKHVRGPQLITEKQIEEQIRKEGLPTAIPLSSLVRLPVRDEVLNILVAGAPGTGKTVFFSQVLESIRKGYKIICHDFKGDYLGRFFDPSKDIIFNPTDKRSVSWLLFNEIRNVLDLQAISHSLIQPSSGEGKFWNDGAREVFSGILLYLYKSRKTSNHDIWNAVSSKAIDVKRMLVEADALAGAKYIEDASSKQALGVLSTLMQYVACFEFMKDADEGCNEFSLLDWLTNKKGGTIYITNYVDCQDVLRPILSLMIDLLARRLLSLPDNIENRVYFILDEFAQLQYLSSVERLLTTARSKGGSVFLGVQDVSQIRSKYGNQGAQTILNACGTSLVFRSPDPDTADYFSRRIGITEYDQYDSNYSLSPKDAGDRQQMTIHHIKEPLVSSAQIQHLPNLETYVSMVSRDIFHTRLQYKTYPPINEAFIMRNGLDIPVSRESQILESPAEQEDSKKFELGSKTQEKPLDL